MRDAALAKREQLIQPEKAALRQRVKCRKPFANLHDLHTHTHTYTHTCLYIPIYAINMAIDMHTHTRKHITHTPCTALALPHIKNAFAYFKYFSAVHCN